MIMLPIDLPISSCYAVLGTVTSDLSPLWLINSAILYVYDIFFLASALPILHLDMRMACAEATSLVLSYGNGFGKLPQA
ncbi:hypothetical protein RchiOBHm_Chr3g0448531 [Rosa chinensis]|uniref:Uncharacterized protein n=1 Tax=Rosa chinensis TaxID=74649 RepID=A0A2P6R579_ROSCH|nr:hypothetical protein RchiOBHm_Chr3g0448531 [Rosa chinensis]